MSNTATQTKVCATNSLPKEQKQEQANPKSVQKVPIGRRRVDRAHALQLAFDRIAFLTSAQQQVSQSRETTKHVNSVRAREQIEERAVRIAGHKDALPRKLPPGKEL